MPVNILYSIFVGVVQGIAEWLPVSSKTQVLVTSTVLFSLPLDVAFAFGLFMEIGSLGSAVIYFGRDAAAIFRDRKLLIFLLIVTVLTGVVGVPLYIISDRLLQNAYNLGIPMTILGAFLIADGVFIRYSRRSPKIGSLTEMKFKHYVVVGLAQGLAALPGVSRSGMTVSSMLFMGVEPKAAFRLSYLAYIPASLGGFLTTLVFSRAEIRAAISAVNPLGVIIAVVSAALVGLVAISTLLRFAKSNRIYIVTLTLGVLAIALGIITSIALI